MEKKLQRLEFFLQKIDFSFLCLSLCLFVSFAFLDTQVLGKRVRIQ